MRRLIEISHWIDLNDKDTSQWGACSIYKAYWTSNQKTN